MAATLLRNKGTVKGPQGKALQGKGATGSAARQGFEPWRLLHLAAFKAAALDHYAISPVLTYFITSDPGIPRAATLVVVIVPASA